MDSGRIQDFAADLDARRGATETTHEGVSLSQDAYEPSIKGEYVPTETVKNTETEIDKIGHWLTPINFKSQQAEAYSRSVEGTGRWLLQHDQYEHWASEDDGVLWCRGIAGAGKTTLASIINVDLQKRFPSIPVLFVFLQQAHQYTVRDIIASLLRQLLESHAEHVLPIVKEGFDRHETEETKASEQELLEWLTRALAPFPKAFITIDALDELLIEEDKAKLLRVLRSLHRSLLFTSRPLDLVQAIFPHAVTMDVRAHDEDIDTFVKRKVQHTSRLKDLLADTEDLKNVVSALQATGAGMFLLTVLQVETLAGSVGMEDLRKKLASLPSGVEDMYQDAWRRMGIQDKEKALLARRVIAWLVYTDQPLTMTMLQHALAVDPESGRFDSQHLVDPGLIVTVCCGIVTVDHGTEVVQLIHHTARDVFQKWVLESGVQPHVLIATSCIGYLNHTGLRSLIFADYHGDDHPHVPFDASDRTIRCWKNVLEFLDHADYPFLSYAYKHWGRHARMLAEDELPPIVLEFLLHQPSTYPLDLDAQVCQPCDLGTSLHVAAQIGMSSALPRIPITGDTTSNRQQTALHLAAFNGHTSFVQTLLESETIPVDAVDCQGQTPLAKASLQGHDGAVRLILGHPNVEVNSKDNRGRTPLWHASAWGQVECMKALLSHPNLDPNIQDSYGRTPLMKTAAWGRYEGMKLLLENPNTLLNLQSDRGETALMLAARFGHTGLVETLLTYAKPIVQEPVPDSGEPSQDGQRELLDINAASKWGLTALMDAAYHGRSNPLRRHSRHEEVTKRADDSEDDNDSPYVAIVKMLLEFPDLDVNAGDRWGRTALMKAAQWGNAQIVAALVADPRVLVNAGDCRGKTALMKAASWGNSTCLGVLLGREDVDANARDAIGETALIKAAVRGMVHCVELLLTVEGIDAKAANDRGETALMKAASMPDSKYQKGGNNPHESGLLAEDESTASSTIEERLATTRALLPFSNANAIDDKGRTALMKASLWGELPFVEELLSSPEIDVNIQDIYADTALKKASSWGHDACVSRLLQVPGIHVNAAESPNLLSFGHHTLENKSAEPEVPLHAKGRVSQSALMKAVLWDQRRCAELLLSHPRIDVNEQDDRGQTALIMACTYGRQEIASALILHPDTDVNIKSSWDEFPLWCCIHALKDGDELPAIDLGGSEQGYVGPTEPIPPSSSPAVYETLVEQLLQRGDIDWQAKGPFRATALMRALQRGQSKIARMILSCGEFDVNEVDDLGESALAKAAGAGDVSVVQRLLQYPGIHSNAPNCKGDTPLIKAAAGGYEDIVRLLLREDPTQVNHRNNKGETALIKAAVWGWESCVRAILECGGELVDVNIANDYGETALIKGAQKGWEPVVKALLERSDILVNSQMKALGQSALSMAAAGDQDGQEKGWCAEWTLQNTACPSYEGVLTRLLAHPSTDPNIRDKYGRTPLMRAAKENSVEIARLLISDPRCDVNAQDMKGESALMMAASWGNLGVVEELLSRVELEVNARNNRNDTALSKACFRGHIDNVVALLSHPKIQPNLQDENGETGLMKASSWGRDGCVSALLKAGLGVDLNVHDSKGESALLKASSRGHSSIVELLVRQPHLDANASDDKGETPLMHASQRGHENCILALLQDERLDIHKRNRNGETALMKAASWGHIDATRALLNAPGQDVNAVDNREDTALIKAAYRGHLDIVRLLLSQRGIKVNHQNRYRATALSQAYFQSHRAVVDLLVANGADVADLNTQPFQRRGSGSRGRWF